MKTYTPITDKQLQAWAIKYAVDVTTNNGGNVRMVSSEIDAHHHFIARWRGGKVRETIRVVVVPRDSSQYDQEQLLPEMPNMTGITMLVMVAADYIDDPHMVPNWWSIEKPKRRQHRKTPVYRLDPARIEEVRLQNSNDPTVRAIDKVIEEWVENVGHEIPVPLPKNDLPRAREMVWEMARRGWVTIDIMATGNDINSGEVKGVGISPTFPDDLSGEQLLERLSTTSVGR
jgi:hypothetical protein